MSIDEVAIMSFWCHLSFFCLHSSNFLCFLFCIFLFIAFNTSCLSLLASSFCFFWKICPIFEIKTLFWKIKIYHGHIDIREYFLNIHLKRKIWVNGKENKRKKNKMKKMAWRSNFQMLLWGDQKILNQPIVGQKIPR